MSGSSSKQTAQFATVAALAVALYLAITCPCKEFLDCHKKEFTIAICAASLAPVLLV